MTPPLLRQAALRLQQQQQVSCGSCSTAAAPTAAAAAFSRFTLGFPFLSRVAAGDSGARLPSTAGTPASAALLPRLPLRQLPSAFSASSRLVAGAPPATASSTAFLPAASAARAGSRCATPAAAAASGLSSAPAATAAAPLQQRQPWSNGSGRQLGCTYTAKRTYLHFNRALPEDFELPADTMPANVGELLSKNPKNMDFFENYWYWKLRGEATVLDPESLPTKSYKQLARDMGMQVVNEETEHMVGLLELYEHLKTATFVGPFGTIEKPVLCPSVTTDRIVGCTGGAGDKEHVPLWFRCREGFLYRCGECDQIFMLVRVFYSLPDGKDPFPVDPDVDDVFDAQLLEKGERMWNSAEYVHWPAGHAAYSQLFLEGKWGNPVPQKLSQELRAVEA